ncbi:MAG: ADP-forming succinate--CoA ligase subunit beta [Bacillota bacterium]|nr:ADP-forming succinate--CoA ligase subunit beta [Bacillota bacterium]
MKLYEYMAKGVLRENGVPVPPGRLARTPEEAEAAARSLGPCVVKAQVLVGGRGKAGGVKPAQTPEEARSRAGEILGMNLKGCVVETVYVESMLGIDRELYLGITMDNAAKRPLLIASASGGMEIEEVPERAIVRQPVPVEWGLMPYATRWVAHRLGLSGDLARQFGEIALKLYEIFRRYDAELVEINPLAVAGDRLVAADARLNVDDDALYRHPDLPRTSEATELEKRVRELGLAYVELDGDIAVMANGAGITMATLDVLQRYGGRPMNFLDAGGGAAAGPMAEALKVLVSTRPKAIFVNIFGGITRCDDVAQAVITARREVGISMPMVVRLVGTNEEKGVEMLRGEGIQAYRSMEEAAARAVELARAGEGVEG